MEDKTNNVTHSLIPTNINNIENEFDLMEDFTSGNFNEISKKNIKIIDNYVSISPEFSINVIDEITQKQLSPIQLPQPVINLSISEIDEITQKQVSPIQLPQPVTNLSISEITNNKDDLVDYDTENANEFILNKPTDLYNAPILQKMNDDLDIKNNSEE
jgi:hypothetical protein